MNTDRADWDREEREMAERLHEELEAVRRRHANDPPIELLRAAHADALPAEMQQAVAEHLSASPMSRALVEGLEPEEPTLTREEQDRLLARIMKEATREYEVPRAWGWLRPVFLGSALAAVATLAWFVAGRTQLAEPLSPPVTQVVVAEPPTLPPFLLPFEKPEVRLGMSALTWRGSAAGDNQLLADLKPGLDAYRQGDYRTADRELTSIAARYPGTIEVLFYQGVSRLFLNDLPGAVAALGAADALGDRTFAADVAWYLAVAEQRSGNLAGARARLDAICRAQGESAARACAALDELAKATATPR